MHGKTGFTIAGRIIFANCAIVAASAFSGTWLSQRYEESSTFVMGALLFPMGLILSLPVNYAVGQTGPGAAEGPGGATAFSLRR